MKKSERRGLHLRRIKRLEVTWKGKITKAMREAVSHVVTVLKRDGYTAAAAMTERIIILNTLAATIRELYVAIGLMTANITARDIKRSVRPSEKKGFGEDPRWTQKILEYFSQFLLNKAVLPITQSMKEAISDLLNKGIAEGWGIDKMAFELEHATFPVWMARRAVRTEIAKAQFYGRQIAEEDSEWETNKTWLAADDARTRPAHNHVDDKTIASDKKFIVGKYRGRVKVGEELMSGPGDPEASAGNVINCRCSLIVRAARDERGRLIPKRKKSNISVILPGRFVNRIEPITI